MAPRNTGTKKVSTAKLQNPTNSKKLAQSVIPSTRKNISKSLKGSRAVFLGKLFVMSGEFPKQIEGWIKHHGGRVGNAITDETTHLVCTVENFKNKVILVKDAIRLGHKRCKIVDWEFIEDSMHPRPRRILEDQYLLRNIVSGNKSRKPTVQSTKQAAKKDSRVTHKVLEPPSHHIYVDETGFEYKVALRRTISPPKKKKLEEVFTIYIFESNPVPPTYVVAKKYKLADKPAVPYPDKDVGKVFKKAFDEFETIFEDKTGIKWDQRLDRLKQEMGKYSYIAPAAGEPIGLLPLGGKESIEHLEQGLDS